MDISQKGSDTKSKDGPRQEPEIAGPGTSDTDVKQMEKERINHDVGEGRKPEQELSGARFPVQKHNILVVDDEPSVLDALERTFRDEYQVLPAKSGEEALSIMEDHEIAVVIADHRMPGMTGIELLERVMQKSPDTIRLILSGYIDQKMLMEAISMVNIHDIIAKPYGIEEIRFTVRKWVEQYKRIKDFEGKARQNSELQRQIKEANTALEEARQHHDIELKRLTQQLEESQRLLEHYQIPWWRRWSKK